MTNNVVKPAPISQAHCVSRPSNRSSSPTVPGDRETKTLISIPGPDATVLTMLAARSPPIGWNSTHHSSLAAVHGTGTITAREVGGYRRGGTKVATSTTLSNPSSEMRLRPAALRSRARIEPMAADSIEWTRFVHTPTVSPETSRTGIGLPGWAATLAKPPSVAAPTRRTELSLSRSRQAMPSTACRES
jgi:hypothetical protein